jgi:hypothetical protein
LLFSLLFEQALFLLLFAVEAVYNLKPTGLNFSGCVRPGLKLVVLKSGAAIFLLDLEINRFVAIIVRVVLRKLARVLLVHVALIELDSGQLAHLLNLVKLLGLSHNRLGWHRTDIALSTASHTLIHHLY